MYKKDRINKFDRAINPKKMPETRPHYEVLDRYVTMRWNQSNINFYKSLGYIFTKFGDEFYIRVDELRNKSQRKVMAKCPLCDNPRRVSYASIQNAGHTYCKKHAAIQDISGFRSGRLVAIEYIGAKNNGVQMWKCVCDCGNECNVASSEVLREGVKSCGCLHDDYINNFPKGKDNKLWDRVELACPVCAKKFFVKKSHQLKYKTHYCSVDCKAKWQRENLVGENSYSWSRVKIVCDNCGNDFYRVRYWAESDSARRFCSSVCFSEYATKYIKGVNHHQWTSKEVECDYCRKKFFKKKYSITDRNFCSKEHFSLYNSGENHHNYNSNLSDEDRQRGRAYLEYKNWVDLVYKRFSYKCVICESSENIVAHHLFSYAEYPEKRLELENGVVLCSNHHAQFHYAFMGGTGNPCTKDDFDEWIDTLDGL